MCVRASATAVFQQTQLFSAKPEAELLGILKVSYQMLPPGKQNQIKRSKTEHNTTQQLKPTPNSAYNSMHSEVRETASLCFCFRMASAFPGWLLRSLVSVFTLCSLSHMHTGYGGWSVFLLRTVEIFLSGATRVDPERSVADHDTPLLFFGQQWW